VRFDQKGPDVINWVYGLPIGAMVVVVFAATFLVAAGICLAVVGLAVGERGRAFKAVSPGLLPPLGIVFALVVGFLAAGVWSTGDRAQLAVNQEASSLRAALLLVDTFPASSAAQFRVLIRRHISDAVTQEWPAMARRSATLSAVPGPLAGALALALSLTPRTAGQTVAQREIVRSIENALDARRQRIIISQSRVNWVKWTGVVALAILALLSIAFVHSDNRGTTAIAMGAFAAAVAVALVLIASQDRPFSRPFGVKPTVIQQVMPRVP
jgi:hypothetical protein